MHKKAAAKMYLKTSQSMWNFQIKPNFIQYQNSQTQTGGLNIAIQPQT